MTQNIVLKFKDGHSKEYPVGIPAIDVIKDHFRSVIDKAVAAKLNDHIIDFSRKLNESGSFDVVTSDTKEGLEVIRHTSSHVMALAIRKFHPKALVTIGPATEDGFYYDFDNLELKEEEFPKIEEEMKKILSERLPVTRLELTKEEALQKFGHEPYKVEIIRDLPADEIITSYKVGEFEDLCRGPHVSHTGKIGAIKLMKLAGAYWKGDSKNKMLTRVYGTSFADKKELQEYLTQLEEAKKRDHRKIGKDLDLFSFHEYSPGSVFFHPKGTIIYNELLKFVREQYFLRGYGEVITPLLYDQALWETSGHWEHYSEDMFLIDVDSKKFAAKPMNCPSHCLIYLNSSKSYKELPLRIADFAPLHRNENRGSLGGLTRVRKFSQDDSHIFCTSEQIGKEIEDLFDFIKYIYDDVFKMGYKMGLSTRPEKSLGTDEMWKNAEHALESALKKKNIDYVVNKGDGAFYGPKIDFIVRDSLNREWQLATVQLDFNLPERFNLEYEGSDGKKHRPVMIHRAILGSLERFIAVLIEHTAGKFPLWLNPVQVKILPVADRHVDYALSIAKKMKNQKIRVEVDDRSEGISKKVRDAQLEQINYILVVGDKEIDENTVTVRTRNNEVLGAKNVDEFIASIVDEINEKRL